MKRLIKNLILLDVAVTLLLTVGVFGIIYTLFWSIRNFTKTSFFKYWSDLVYTINIGIDKLGNVMLGAFMNRFAVTELQYPFGRLEDTISYALAMNIGYLSPLGEFIVTILEAIDPGHMQDAIDRKV
jgi:hypothetical protein